VFQNYVSIESVLMKFSALKSKSDTLMFAYCVLLNWNHWLGHHRKTRVGCFNESPISYNSFKGSPILELHKRADYPLLYKSCLQLVIFQADKVTQNHKVYKFIIPTIKKLVKWNLLKTFLIIFVCSKCQSLS
jgi:hypothetical protein